MLDVSYIPTIYCFYEMDGNRFIIEYYDILFMYTFYTVQRYKQFYEYTCYRFICTQMLFPTTAHWQSRWCRSLVVGGRTCLLFASQYGFN